MREAKREAFRQAKLLEIEEKAKKEEHAKLQMQVEDSLRK